MNVLLGVEGGEQLVAKLRAKEREFLDSMAEQLPAEGEQLRSEANALAPVASGQLVSSSVVESEVKPSHVRTGIGYTDPKAPAVHEGIHWGHKIKAEHRRKWLERALHAFAGGFAERVAARLRALVGG